MQDNVFKLPMETFWRQIYKENVDENYESKRYEKVEREANFIDPARFFPEIQEGKRSGLETLWMNQEPLRGTHLRYNDGMKFEREITFKKLQGDAMQNKEIEAAKKKIDYTLKKATN